jgi:putative ABC transport system permease protein
MSDFRDNVKHAVRMFRMNPGFTFPAVAALALGIGINTAIFTVVDAVLLKPLTYPDADRIVEFMITSPQGNAAVASIPKFVSLQQQTSIFQDLAAYDLGGPGFNLTGGRPEQVHGIHVTQAYFLRHKLPTA